MVPFEADPGAQPRPRSTSDPVAPRRPAGQRQRRPRAKPPAAASELRAPRCAGSSPGWRCWSPLRRAGRGAGISRRGPTGRSTTARTSSADAEERRSMPGCGPTTQRTGRAMIVATVPSLDGEEIELTRHSSAETWGIGGKESETRPAAAGRAQRAQGADRGRLRPAPVLTDILSGRIIRDDDHPAVQGGRHVRRHRRRRRCDHHPARAATRHEPRPSRKPRAAARGAAKDAAPRRFRIGV